MVTVQAVREDADEVTYLIKGPRPRWSCECGQRNPPVERSCVWCNKDRHGSRTSSRTTTPGPARGPGF